MKVELLVNLKIGSGRIISSGTIFSDENAPIPDFVLRRLDRKMARIVPESKKVEAPSDKPGGASSIPVTGKKEATFKTRSTEKETETVKKEKKVKKILAKKAVSTVE